MSRNARVVLGVVLVVIAGGGWWLWTRRAAPTAPAASEPATPTEVARRERPERGDPGELPRVLIDDDPRGALRLEGQVIDADEHGVAGATVVITANPPREAKAEADGSFAFDGLVARPYTLIARAAGRVAGPVTARLTEKSEPVVLRLRPAAKLRVAVVAASGAPITGATVELRGLDVQRAMTRDGPAVFSPVVPGVYQIAAWADGKARAFQRIQIGKGDADARLVLASGAPVTGRVVDDRGAGIGDARVRHSGASDWTQQASDRHDAQVTAADGSFRFDALPAGSLRFSAGHPERAPASSALITLDGRTPRDGVVIVLEVGAVVRGKVVDGQHRPVASARVRIGSAPDRGGPRGRPFEPPRQTYSDAQGAFEIRGLARKPLQAVALHDSGASDIVAIDASRGDVAGVVLTLDRAGAITGIVVDPVGQPVEGAQVAAAPVFGRGVDPGQFLLRGLPEDTSDAAGRFTLTGLAAGQYRLSAVPATRTGPRLRGAFRDGVVASPGATGVRLVVQPDGSVHGKVAFADGTAPELFTVSVQQVQQSFVGGGGAFRLDGIAPGTYQLAVRGPSFQHQAIEVAITGAAATDAGTITVVEGRTLAGVVVADGQPVSGATVYAGRVVFGSGSTSATQNTGNPLAEQFASGTKTTTTDAAGGFSLSGFGNGDLTLIAEHEAIGRSRALRLPTVMPGQTELSLTLEKFGALSGMLRRAGKPVDGVTVSCQSTSTPGAVWAVATGSDGAYRFDRLAPDSYKVSATAGDRRSGLRFYSRQMDIPAGREVILDLAIDPGTASVDVALAAPPGKVGAASVWLANGAITAATASELLVKLAATGGGWSSRTPVLGGEPAHFIEVPPGSYTACATPLPLEVRPMGMRDYIDRHADALATFCTPVAVAPVPAAQTVPLTVQVPAFISDPQAPNTGSGTGSGPGPGGPGPGGPGGGSGARP